MILNKPYPDSSWKDMIKMSPVLLIFSIIVTIISSGFPKKGGKNKKE